MKGIKQSKALGILESAVPYIVMEYYPYGDLFSIIKQTGPLPERMVVTAMKSTGSAFLKMHQNGWTHRDIKLDNIVVAKSGMLVVAD